jgi:2-dehydropantoate 2-reductase
MHVAILGMGALGRVYGVRLATRASCQVTFIVREGRAASPLRLARIDGDGAKEELASPSIAHGLPEGADVLLVCVRAEQLDPAFDALVASSPAVPVIMLTPVMPHALERLMREHGDRVRVAMPGVVSYVAEGDICRYWLPRVAPTLVDATPAPPDAVVSLVQALVLSGFDARLEKGVRDTNPATTVAFIPLAMGVDAAGGIDALLADKALRTTTLAAVSEGLALAARIGKTPTWVDLLARFAGPTMLKIGIGIARSRAPEALHYVDAHFGRKLHAQNVAMARDVVKLAEEKKTPSAALTALLRRLERSP